MLNNSFINSPFVAAYSLNSLAHHSFSQPFSSHHTHPHPQIMYVAVDAIIHDQSRLIADLLASSAVDVSFKFGRSMRTLLHIAACFGASECVTLLVKHGADVNAQDTTGVTPSHLAARNGHKRCLKLLINEFGADTTIVDGDGLSMVHWLASHGRNELLEHLLGLGHPTDMRDRHGQVRVEGGICKNL